MKSLLSVTVGAMSKSACCLLFSYINQPFLDKYAVEILKYSKCSVLVKNCKYVYILFYSSSFLSKNLKYE